MLRNWRRNWFTSAALKPALRRRSKPRGAAVVLGRGVLRPPWVFGPGRGEPEGEGGRRGDGGGGAAACVASAASSVVVRLSPMLQFT